MFKLINVEAQTVKLGFESGVGTYLMSDLKNYMSETISGNILQPKIVTNFPPYLYFQPSISFCNEKSNWGFNFSIMSTGSRASIRDYSGEYKYDNKLAAFAPAFFEEYQIYNNNQVSVYFHASVGMLYSKLHMSEYFKVNNEEFQDLSIDLMSIGFFAKPVIKATYPINRNLNIEGNIGYHFDIHNGAFVENTDPVTYFRYALFHYGLKPKWNGIRLGLGCVYKLK